MWFTLSKLQSIVVCEPSSKTLPTVFSDCARAQSRASGGARELGGRARCRNSASSRTTTAAHLASQTHLSTHGLEILNETDAIFVTLFMKRDQEQLSHSLDSRCRLAQT